MPVLAGAWARRVLPDYEAAHPGCGLARGVYLDGAFDRLPVLADALEDAGFARRPTLAHLRRDRGIWTRADWVLWNLLDMGGC